MNSAATNILITAQAAQAVATLNRVQAQLRALQIAARTAQTSSNGSWFGTMAAGQGRITATQASLRGFIASTNTANAASNRPWFASMTAAGSRLQWIGKQLTMNFTAPLLLAAGAGVKFGLDMEKSMTRLKKVYGDGSMSAKQQTNEVKALEKAMIALSDTYGVASDEVANVAADWAAAGSSGKALAEQTKLTLETMILGEMDAEEATKSLIAIQAQWGAVTETTSDKLDKNGKVIQKVANDKLSLTTILRQLNAVENETGTSMQDLVTAFSKASGVARTVGLDTAHLAAMVAALVPAAGSATEAGNGLKTMLTRVMNPTRATRQVLDAMGISLSDAGWQSANAAQRLEMLSEKFGGLTQAQKIQASALVASVWQINKFEVLMDSMRNKMGYYHKSLALLADQDRVAMIAQRELNAVLESSPQRAKQAGAIIKNSLMKAMEPLIPVIIQVALWFGKLFRAFSEISPSVRSLIVVILLVMAALGPMIIMMGLLKLSIGQLAPIFAVLGRAILLPLAPLKLLSIAFWASMIRSTVAAKALLGVIAVGKVFAIGMTSVAAITVGAWRLLYMAVASNALKTAAVWVSTTGMMMLASFRLQASLIAAALILKARLLVINASMWIMMVAANASYYARMLAMNAMFYTGMVFAILVAKAKIIAATIATWATTTAITAAGIVRNLGLWALFSRGVGLIWAGMRAVAAAGAAAMVTIQTAMAAASLVVQKAWAVATLVTSAAMWKGLIALALGGSRGIVTVVARAGAMLLAVLASPWALAIGVVVGLIVMFRTQIVQAFNNIVNYFKNLPAETAKGLSPLTNIFVKAKNAVVNAFNALPAGVKNALLAVVRIVRAAAMKVYELFSYINPFARHSPSLVENVTNGMAEVNRQFTNSAAVAKRSINEMHASVKSLEGMGKGLAAANAQADRDKVASNAGKAGVGNAMPEYDRLNAQVKASKAELASMNAAIEAQEAKLKSVKAGVEAYDAALEKMNSELATTESIQQDVSRALDAAKARYDRFANAQIKGMGAAEDAIFANTMAQKRLQLQIKKMEQESGGVDSLTDSYSKLQGSIEELTAKQKELREGGAGSDVLGEYDKMIAELKAQQGGIMDGQLDGPAGKLKELNDQLQQLQNQAEIMDLEKSLQFDSLNRNIEKFKNNVEELPYGQIMQGMDSSRTSVNNLQYAYDSLGIVIDGQKAKIADTQAARDALQKTYDAENTKLEKVKETYQELEEAIRSGEQAMQDFASQAEQAVQRQEEAAAAAEKAAKAGKKGKGGGGGDDTSNALQNFEDAGAGDFPTFGGKDTIGREGGLGDQSSQIDQFTKSLTEGLETSLGGLNPFAPLMKWWDNTVNWFKGMMGPFGDIFSGIGEGIRVAFGSDDTGAVSGFGQTIQTVKDSLSGFWDTLKTIGSLIGGLFGPDLMTSVSEFGKGFADIWGKISGPLKDLGAEVMPFIKAAFEALVPVIGIFVGALEIIWEVINGAIGPVFNWLGDIIKSIIQVITGVVKIITGVINVVVGLVKTVIGVIKGIFTGDWSTAIEGLKQLFSDGFGKIFSGIWDIVKGIFGAIWSTIKNFVSLIINTIWGFIKGVIDFFTELWDVLVGHSIVPDMVNAIIEWFFKLPGTLLGMIGDFIVAIVTFFFELPGKILGALGELGGLLGEWLGKAWTWLKDNAPGLAEGFMQWVRDFPENFMTGLGVLGDKIGPWFGKAWDWLKDNAPNLILGFLTWVAGIPGFILEKLGQPAGMLLQYGKDMIQGLLDGAGSLLKDIGKFMLDKLPGWIKEPFKKAMGIASPSKVFKGYGKNLGEGLVIGMDGQQKAVEDSSKALAAAADTGPIDISAAPDTSSVTGAMNAVAKQAAAAPAATATIDAQAGAVAAADPSQLNLDSTTAELDAFIADSTAKLDAFNAQVTGSMVAMAEAIAAAFKAIETSASTSFTALAGTGVSQFTTMQTTLVAIVTKMVADIAAQLQSLLEQVKAFTTQFAAAWQALWDSWSTKSVEGVDKTLTEWERLAEGLNNTVETGIKPVFDSLAEMLKQTEEGFTKSVENIGTAWGGLKEGTAAPVRFTVNTVYNEGLLATWNGVADLIGGNKMSPISLKFRDGGPVRGPGTETSDSIPALLSKNEYVLSADAVRRAGGVGNLNKFNFSSTSPQGMFGIGGRGQVIRRATGGPADPGSPSHEALQRGYLYARKIAPGPYVLGGSSGGSSANGTDCSGYQSEIADVIMGGPGGARKWATGSFPGGGGSQGAVVRIGNQTWLKGLGAGHSVGISVPHAAGTLGGVPGLPAINVESGGGTGQGATFGGRATGADDRQFPTQYHLAILDSAFVSGGGGSGASMKEILGGMVKPGLDKMMQQASDYSANAKGFNGQIPKLVAAKWNETTLKKIEAESAKLDVSGPAAVGGVESVERWRPMATAALKRNGFLGDKRDQDLMLKQIMTESGGRPGVLQTVQDVNSGGNEAQGLLQIVPGTFAAYRDQTLPNDRTDPWANMNAALRYYKDRYGNDLGTHWGKGFGYDNGGFLQPGIIGNFTGGVEPVLTSQQWNAMYTIAANAPRLNQLTMQEAVERANEETGNTDKKQTEAIIKGMEVWQEAWKPLVFDATEKSTKATESMTKAATAQTGSTQILTKSIGKWDTTVKELSKALTQFSQSMQQSIQVQQGGGSGGSSFGTINLGGVNGGGGGSGANAGGFSMKAPTFGAWAPMLNVMADLLEALPYAERNWTADNPVPGETEKQRKQRIAANNLTNFAKGSYNVVKDVGPPVLRHTAIIGSAVEKLVYEDGEAWSAAFAAIAQNNPAGYAIAVLLGIKTVATLAPLILAAIMDIVPALIRAIVRFLTQFMPDSVFAYADLAAAENAVLEQQEGGEVAQGQGRRYPTEAMVSPSGNAPVNLFIYGDLEMPNVSDGSDANEFVDQLRLLASK
ncbi:putative major tail protein [Tsukamurella phage TIN4]|uniref:Putative major tail protein n=2 Tax=Tinduovirus TIN3 TaxID=1982571 RepID=A0A0K0N5Y4_9CAUD|nr:tail length tape measure protein [Tsukamurella phage TIN3]YP_009604148.1 tail length tape measure protein [Tsukamurella phage TIN4]AKJ71815.1 putative tape measure protein [Tsukamurella phage TIN3]AKJ71924.1 putative major tail protein [Tsukamurella phage TIN4]